MSFESELFTPYELADTKLANRLVMSPMGRRRAADDGTPTELMAEYYRQRAGAGLLITESTHPCPEARSQPNSPYLCTPAQVAGWERVTSAVHEAGGRIFVQLMHAGLAAHPDVNGGHQPMGPSAVRPQETTKLGDQVVEHPETRAMSESDIRRAVDAHVSSAVSAVAAGFDGVELHAGNGFLLHQFLAAGTNHRTDAYGGSPAANCRLAIEVAAAVANAIGPERVGIKISPGFSITRIAEGELTETYGHLLNSPEITALAYCHTSGFSDSAVLDLVASNWGGTWLHNAGVDPVDDSARVRQRLAEPLERGADLVSAGRTFIANPDLVTRLAEDRTLAIPDPATFYAGGSNGYTDY
ncbi:hypothetical protein CDG81_12715 [Actinopolyspora erythraea]|uniref:NADH:flavin oxidoreductase/NADH oxidase N-terminal domain-containing protein n=1 Tax=Actinopolyspora erythraea TaxID=414996 RepID=A0A099D4P1_9ACTN|nr:hypothetical protein [Actinopolyspora erythraea]ASU79007.1 hypothetical protein CDG81_12715 [Actinopolyspora erythraea]KGI81133.1 hypothetical protein IL38_12800 [Actinopolyspora erythraea]